MRVNEYAGNKEDHSQHYKAGAQYCGELFKEISSKTYGENSFTHIRDILSNKLHARFVKLWHRSINIPYVPVRCQEICTIKRGGVQ